MLNQSEKSDLSFSEQISESQARSVFKNNTSQNNEDYLLNWKNSNNSNNSNYFCPQETLSFEELLSNFYKNRTKFENNQANFNNLELLKGVSLQKSEDINQITLVDKVFFLNIYYKNLLMQAYKKFDF